MLRTLPAGRCCGAGRALRSGAVVRILRTLPASPAGRCCGAGRALRSAPQRGTLQVLAVRNRGRLRDPYDTPLRDGNRDRLYGLLTTRAAATLLAYCFETNQVQAKWLTTYMSEARPQTLRNPKLQRVVLTPRRAEAGPTQGHVGGDLRRRVPKEPDVPGSCVLRQRVAHAVTPSLVGAAAQEMQTIDNPYTGDRLTIDPRNLAQRILEARAPPYALAHSCLYVCWRERVLRRIRAQIRVHLAKEFVEDLKFVKARAAASHAPLLGMRCAYPPRCGAGRERGHASRDAAVLAQAALHGGLGGHRRRRAAHREENAVRQHALRSSPRT